MAREVAGPVRAAARLSSTVSSWLHLLSTLLPTAPAELSLLPRERLIHCIRTRRCRCLDLLRHRHLDCAILVLPGALSVAVARLPDIGHLPQDDTRPACRQRRPHGRHAHGRRRRAHLHRAMAHARGVGQHDPDRAGWMAATTAARARFSGAAGRRAAPFALSRRGVRYQGSWMARVQTRIDVTSAVLTHIKDLRVSGMTSPAAALVQREREDEIRVGERSRVMTAISASLSQLPQAVAPALAFAFGPHVLDETRAYTALSFLTLLTAPLLVVLQSLPIIAACVACLRRIKVFLIQEERVNGRLLKPENIGSDNIEKLDAEKETFVVIRDGSFGWTTENAILKKINLCLPRSFITFVVDPIASGKSTLCRALLGEVPFVQGSVVLKVGQVELLRSGAIPIQCFHHGKHCRLFIS